MTDLLLKNTGDIIDWTQSLTLAGQNRALAIDLITMLCKLLPTEIEGFKQELQTHSFSAFKQRLHKLKGAVSYCGVPRLMAALLTLDHAVTHQEASCLSAFLQFEVETSELILKVKSLENALHV